MVLAVSAVPGTGAAAAERLSPPPAATTSSSPPAGETDDLFRLRSPGVDGSDKEFGPAPQVNAEPPIQSPRGAARPATSKSPARSVHRAPREVGVGVDSGGRPAATASSRNASGAGEPNAAHSGRTLPSTNPASSGGAIAGQLETSVEWYRPTSDDARLAMSPRSAWRGRWYAADAQLRFHHFVYGPPALDGQSGGMMLARFDIGRNFGVHIGGYFPSSMLVAGMHLFSGHGVPVADLAGLDLQIGILLPQINIDLTTNTRATYIVSAGADLVGVRFIFFDALKLDLRMGGPSIWFSIPQLGLALSWSGSLDMGVYF